MVPAQVEGSCLCGEVVFCVILPTNFLVHCHCSICRRAHGSPFVTWAGVNDQQLKVVKGKERLRTYRSSEKGSRTFCSQCGSPLFFKSSERPEETHVAVSQLKSELDRTPQCHVYFDDKVDWITLDDNLPRCGGVTGTEPLNKKK